MEPRPASALTHEQCGAFSALVQRRSVPVGEPESARWPLTRNKDIVQVDEGRATALNDEGFSETPERQRSAERPDGGTEVPAPVAFIDALEFTLSRSQLGATAAVTESARSLAGLEPVLEQLVRAVAWSGDRRRGVARIELGGSSFGGAKLWIESHGNALRIELDAPAGVDASQLAARLTARLEARGLRVDELRVL